MRLQLSFNQGPLKVSTVRQSALFGRYLQPRLWQGCRYSYPCEQIRGIRQLIASGQNVSSSQSIEPSHPRSVICVRTAEPGSHFRLSIYTYEQIQPCSIHSFRFIRMWSFGRVCSCENYAMMCVYYLVVSSFCFEKCCVDSGETSLA